jgi:hypothetical protein
MLRHAHIHGSSGTVLADHLSGTLTEIRQPLAAEVWTCLVGIDSTSKIIAVDADLGPVPNQIFRPRPTAEATAESPGRDEIASVKQWGRRTYRRLPQSDMERGDERKDERAFCRLASPTGGSALGW